MEKIHIITKEDISELKHTAKIGGLLCGIPLFLLSIFPFITDLCIGNITDVRVLSAKQSVLSTYNSIFPFVIGIFLIYLFYSLIPFLYYRNKIGEVLSREG